MSPTVFGGMLPWGPPIIGGGGGVRRGTAHAGPFPVVWLKPSLWMRCACRLRPRAPAPDDLVGHPWRLRCRGSSTSRSTAGMPARCSVLGAVTGHPKELRRPGRPLGGGAPGGSLPRLVFVTVPEEKSIKNRVHLDLLPNDSSQEDGGRPPPRPGRPHRGRSSALRPRGMGRDGGSRGQRVLRRASAGLKLGGCSPLLGRTSYLREWIFASAPADQDLQQKARDFTDQSSCRSRTSARTTTD